MRTLRRRAAVAGLLLLAACSSNHTLMDAIDGFDGERLERATEWKRGGIVGAVYVRPGEKLPDAELQVGVILSEEHELSTDLQSWIAGQTGTEQHYFSDWTASEACVVGMTERERLFMAITKCDETGDGWTACVQVDEPFDHETFTTCLGSPGCFREQCDVKWDEQRQQLIELVTQVLAR